MFKKNHRHLQPALISNVNDLPEKQRMVLETSWSGGFFREFFCRVNEQPFGAMYVDFPSRPNAPINDQTRHTLGLGNLGEVHFEMRTVYNFRLRISQYMQEKEINLLDQAFEQVTNQQIAAFGIKTGKQRMDKHPGSLEHSPCGTVASVSGSAATCAPHADRR